MKYFFALLFMFLAAPVFAAPVQQQSGVAVFGFLAGSGIESGGTETQNFNSGTTWRARGLNLSEGKTINEVRVYCSGKTGTPADTDIHLKLRTSSTSGGPTNSDTEDRTLTATPSCPGWIEATGYSTALTASTQYYIVINNSHGTPASNYVTLAAVRRITYHSLGGGVAGDRAGFSGWSLATSSDSGATWASGNSIGGAAGMRIGFSDGTFAGLPISAQNKDSTNQIYDTREAGVYFTTPSTYPTMNVAGISFSINWSGTKPANLRYRLYAGTSLVATTQTANDEDIVADGWVPLYFSSIQTLSPNTLYRVVAGAVTGGSSGNAYNLNGYTWDSDADSTAMLPYGLRGTYYNGSSWAESSTQVYPFAVLLDTGSTGPFTTSGGSAGPKNLNNMKGSMQ